MQHDYLGNIVPDALNAVLAHDETPSREAAANAFWACRAVARAIRQGTRLKLPERLQKPVTSFL